MIPSSISDLTGRKVFLHGLPSGGLKRSVETHQFPLPPKSGYSIPPVWPSSYLDVNSAWVVSVNIENNINEFTTSCYRIMLNIKRLDSASTPRIYVMTNTQPLISILRQHRLHFLGHNFRMPDDDPCMGYALFLPTYCKLRPLQQRTSYIQELLGIQKTICRQMQLLC